MVRLAPPLAPACITAGHHRPDPYPARLARGHTHVHSAALLHACLSRPTLAHWLPPAPPSPPPGPTHHLLHSRPTPANRCASRSQPWWAGDQAASSLASTVRTALSWTAIDRRQQRQAWCGVCDQLRPGTRAADWVPVCLRNQPGAFLQYQPGGDPSCGRHRCMGGFIYFFHSEAAWEGGGRCRRFACMVLSI